MLTVIVVMVLGTGEQRSKTVETFFSVAMFHFNIWIMDASLHLVMMGV